LLENSRRQRCPKSSHLRSSFDFENIKRFGKRQQGPHLALVALKRQEFSPSPVFVQGDRLAVVISRRIGGAVIRNRWRRRIRELFRREILNWQVPEGKSAGNRASKPKSKKDQTDYLVIVRTAGKPPKTPVLREEIKTLISKT
jgi:ribonuclease P protein component